MISGVKIKAKLFWTWLKHHWKIPAVVLYTFLMWLVFRKNATATLAVLEIKKESYKKEVDALNEAHKMEIEKRDKILAEYDKVLEKLEEKYKHNMFRLDSEKKARAKRLIEDYHDDPESLSKLMSVVFGIDYVG